MVGSTLHAPSLTSFLEIAGDRTVSAETALEVLIALMKRRQIQSSRQVSMAVARLCLKYIALSSYTHVNDVQKLIQGLRSLGRRLMAAQPRELVMGNIVRRVLGVIREETKENDEQRLMELATSAGILSGEDSKDAIGKRLNEDISSGKLASSQSRNLTLPQEPDYEYLVQQLAALKIPYNQHLTSKSTSMSLSSSFSPSNVQRSMFALLAEGPRTPSAPPTPPVLPEASNQDLRQEIISGIKEIIEELGQVDDQIAQHSESYIHANEIILVHGPSLTVQRFLLMAALKRKFTVIVVESYPNDHVNSHSLLNPVNLNKKTSPFSSEFDDPMPLNDLKKTLAKHGVEVMLVPDSSVFAIMSRINKVILGTHVVMSNGSLVATAGAKTIAIAAREHSIPVVVVTGVYKLSPTYPFDEDRLLEIGGAEKVVGWEDGEMVGNVEIVNPVMDFVPEGLVDLYITNAGGHSPSYLYKLVEENYNAIDIDL